MLGKHQPLVRSVIVLAALSLIVPWTAAGPSAAEPGPESLVIVGDVTYADDTYTFEQPILIPAGSTLRFENADVFLDYQGETCPTTGLCPAQIILDGGRLEIVSSTVDTQAPDPSNPDGIAYWRGVGDAAVLFIEDSTLKHSSGLSIQGTSSEISVVRGSVFTDGFEGVSFSKGANAIVTGNLFDGLHSAGGSRDSTTAWISNTFRDLSGYGLNLQGTIIGDHTFASGHVVTDNTFEGNWIGMLHLDAGPSMIQDNTFVDNEIGLNLGIGVGTGGDGEPARVTNNWFEGNGEAAKLYTAGLGQANDDIRLDMRGSAFVDNTCNDLDIHHHETVSYTLDVRESWWGSADGPRDPVGPDCPSIDIRVPSTVLVEPWLTSAPVG